MLRIPIIKRYKNIDRTLTDKFAKRFTENLEKELIQEKLINREVELYTRAQQKSTYMINILEFTFLDDFKGFIDEIDIGGCKTIPSYLSTNVFVTEKLPKKKGVTSFEDSAGTTAAKSCFNIKSLKTCEFKESKVTNLSKCLNNELSRISHGYGKLESMKRFNSNPIRDKLFEDKKYYAFRNNRMTEVRQYHRRAKLAPLYIKEDPKERLARTLFNMKRNILRYVKDNL
jgi:hypothetical protein